MVYPLFHSLLAPYVSTFVTSIRSTRKQKSTRQHDVITVGGGGGTSGSKNGRVRVSAHPMTNMTFSESEERMVGNMEMKPWSEASSIGTEKTGHDHIIQKEVEVAVVTTQDGVAQDTQLDQQRQQALADLDESAKKDHWHFAFAQGPTRKDHDGGA